MTAISEDEKPPVDYLNEPSCSTACFVKPSDRPEGRFRHDHLQDTEISHFTSVELSDLNTLVKIAKRWDSAAGALPTVQTTFAPNTRAAMLADQYTHAKEALLATASKTHEKAKASAGYNESCALSHRLKDIGSAYDDLHETDWNVDLARHHDCLWSAALKSTVCQDETVYSMARGLMSDLLFPGHIGVADWTAGQMRQAAVDRDILGRMERCTGVYQHDRWHNHERKVQSGDHDERDSEIRGRSHYRS